MRSSRGRDGEGGRCALIPAPRLGERCAHALFLRPAWDRDGEGGRCARIPVPRLGERCAHAPFPRPAWARDGEGGRCARSPAPRPGGATCAAPSLGVRALGGSPQVAAMLVACAFLLSLSAHTDANQDVQSTCPEIQVTQDLLKEGFHRDLLIEVELGGSVQDAGGCQVLLKQEIPSGLYVDPYELASLRESNTTEATVVPDSVDVEAPEYLAEGLDVFISARAAPEHPGLFRAVFPVHCRYHRPQEKDGVATVVLKKPDVLVRCSKAFPTRKCWKPSEVAAPCSLRSEQLCRWSSVEYKLVSKELRCGRASQTRPFLRRRVMPGSTLGTSKRRSPLGKGGSPSLPLFQVVKNPGE
ncbi:phosphatidylinositol-glycan biosynthesis class X protein [Tachyglossus aculeatus]|uniref:phosphatidylinositol-glycan biosynthesis class X protein n=1 Tax=Tachyglossus aculeatus TaxID=9261 RepID=UPI0018F5CD75|nr:phosphatidylinositol-glycan biosynthesis class X protein [Tachyglossus aculeatus]